MALQTYVRRALTEELKRTSKSILLLGPRQTGKSTLLNEIFPKALKINLADEAEYLAFASDPRTLGYRLGNSYRK